MGLIGNADPIYRAQNDGLVGAKQHDPARPQAKVPFVSNRIISHHAADGRSGVDVKDRKRQSARFRSCRGLRCLSAKTDRTEKSAHEEQKQQSCEHGATLAPFLFEIDQKDASVIVGAAR